MIDDKQIRDNIGTYYYDVEMPGGYSHNLPNTLRQIEAWYNSQFMSGPLDDQGQEKIFYNINKPTCDVAKKFTDLDPKHIIFVPERNGQGVQFALLQRRFKHYLKITKFGRFLNYVNNDYSKFGHFISKKTKEGNKKVSLFNMRMNPGIEKLEKGSWVYEVIEMSGDEIQGMNWNNEEGLERIKNMDKETFILYECYHKEGKKWKRTIKTGLYWKSGKEGIIETAESQSRKGRGEYLPSITLHEDTVSKLPYREEKWEDVEGRYLGLGFVELLFPEQQRTNEIGYLKGKSLYLKALQAFTSADDTVGTNLITDIEFGQIIPTRFPVNQISRDNVDLSAYNQEENRLDILITKKTHNTDIAMGETMPSQMPLGLGQLQAQMTMSYYNEKRENFGYFVKDLLFEDILPEFRKANRDEHEIFIPKTDDEYEVLLLETVDAIFNKNRKENESNGRAISPEESTKIKAGIEEELRSRKYLAYQIDKNYYDNIEANIDIVVTDESFDMQTRQSIYQFAMNTLSTNPQVLINPMTRGIFFKMMELQGQSAIDLGMMKEMIEKNLKNNPNLGVQEGQVQGQGQPQAPQTQQPQMAEVNV